MWMLLFCVAQIHFWILRAAESGNPFKIFSESAFHLTGSRVCWRTAQRWRTHRPCARHLYSPAGQAVRCRTGGGGTSDTRLSIYCSLDWKKDTIVTLILDYMQMWYELKMTSVCRCPPLTSQVEFCECVSGGWAHSGQQVNWVVCEDVAVGKVQFC